MHLIMVHFFSAQSEMDRKKMEVRARLEQQSQSRKKKGFMTPERKKKLRVDDAKSTIEGMDDETLELILFQLLLRKKAAEELKKEQELKAAERRRVIDQRCGQPKNLDSCGEGEETALAWTLTRTLTSARSTRQSLSRSARTKATLSFPPTNRVCTGDLRRICEEFYKRVCTIENDKYDIEKEVDFKDYKVYVGCLSSC